MDWKLVSARKDNSLYYRLSECMDNGDTQSSCTANVQCEHEKKLIFIHINSIELVKYAISAIPERD